MVTAKTPPQKPAADLCTYWSVPDVDFKEPNGLYAMQRLRQARVFAQVTPEFFIAHGDRAP